MTRDELPQLTLTTTVEHGVLTINARGDLDLNTCQILLATARDHAGPSTVVVDLADVEFCDSAGLGALVSMYKAALRTDGRLVLRTPTENLRQLFDVTGLRSLFTIEPADGPRHPEG